VYDLQKCFALTMLRRGALPSLCHVSFTDNVNIYNAVDQSIFSLRRAPLKLNFSPASSACKYYRHARATT